MKQEIHNYQDKNILLKGYLSYDNATPSPKPAVLICPDWTGRNTFANQQADEIAKLGFVGFALDVYGGGKQGQNNEEKSALMQPFLDDRELLGHRLLAAFDTVKKLEFVDSNQIAVIGFCFGGLCALDLARSGAHIKGAVSFHGLLNPPPSSKSTKIKAKILILHGHEDPMVSSSQLKNFEAEMKAAHTDWQIHIYGNTQHAFTNPLANSPDLGLVYNPLAAKRSFQAMKNFLHELFN